MSVDVSEVEANNDSQLPVGDSLQDSLAEHLTANSNNSPADICMPMVEEYQKRNKDLETLNSELQERIQFLERSLEARERECDELVDILILNATSVKELEKTNRELRTADAKKDKSQNDLKEKVEQMQQKLEQIQKENGNYLTSRAKKSYHELKHSQKSKANQDIRGTIVPEINQVLKKRKLVVSSIEFADADGEESNVHVDAQHRQTFEQLTPAGRRSVAEVSDARSYSRQSDEKYAAFRRAHPSLPPLSHIKAHDKLVIASLGLSLYKDAPSKPGGFMPIRDELVRQLEFLFKMGKTTPAEIIMWKWGIDGTRLTNKQSVCVFTVATITPTGSDIGLVGACIGYDAYEDMLIFGGPFFKDVADMERNPEVTTKVGTFNTIARIGGDLSNLYDLFGLKKATSSHPCVVCVLPKAEFADVFTDPNKLHACNSTLLRNKAHLFNEARGAKNYSVKNVPLSPTPLDPRKALLLVVLFCMLHLRMRITGGVV